MDPSSSARDPSAPRAGQVVAGRYRLNAPVGAGGLASVWEAEHVTLHSLYAVKFLHQTGPADGEPAQRFLREARIAASIKHRNVLEIVDFGFMDGEPGASERGVPYMVMELLRGRTLGALLEAEPKLDVRRAVDLAAGVLRGLAAVHAAGLLHRDVKPHNVFLVEDEDGAFPKLVDFGLSRRTGRSDLTLEGTMLGTPLYMAPEQVAARSDLDARVDIYAMGVVLYEMLAGRPPFKAPTIAEVLDLVTSATPTPLRELVPGIPSAIVAVVEMAMQKAREQRFPDAKAMRAALLDAMQVRASSPVPTSPRIEHAAPRVERAVEVASTLRAARPIEDADSEPPPAPPRERPPRESTWLVLVRSSVLAALAVGVAVLVLDGPWAHDADDPARDVVVSADAGLFLVASTEDASDGGADIADAALASPEDAPADAALDAAPDATFDAETTDTSTSDAAIELDAALDDATTEEDASIDAASPEDASVIDAFVAPEPTTIDAGGPPSPGRGVSPPRRARPGRVAPPPRPTRRHPPPRRTTPRRRGAPRTRRPR